jgi:predicted dehydrogenase
MRAGLAVRAMRCGKDFLSDRPGMTTLEQLAEVRKTIAETKRIYAILYSELLEVKAAVYAGVLVRQGAIGKVIQTISIAPQQIVQHGGDADGAMPRPSRGKDGKPRTPTARNLTYRCSGASPGASGILHKA